jgi:hypothetical protein
MLKVLGSVEIGRIKVLSKKLLRAASPEKELLARKKIKKMRVFIFKVLLPLLGSYYNISLPFPVW